MTVPADEVRVAEVIAEASAQVIIDVTLGALVQYLNSTTTVADVLSSISFVGAEADRVLVVGWGFLDRRRGELESGGSAMIPGNGWVALFSHEITSAKGEKRTFESRSPIVYFDEDGAGWVAPESGRRLRAVTSFSNFTGYDREPVPVGIVPGGGWIRRTNNGEELAIIAWVVFADGDVRPVEGQGDGAQIQSAFEVVEGFEPPGGWPEDVSA